MDRGRSNRHLGLTRHGRLQFLTGCPLHVRLQFGCIGIRTAGSLHHGRQRCSLGRFTREGGQLGRTTFHSLGRRRAHAGIGTITAAAARQQRQQRCPHRELIALAHLFSFYPVEKELQKHVVASCSPQPWRQTLLTKAETLTNPTPAANFGATNGTRTPVLSTCMPKPPPQPCHKATPRLAPGCAFLRLHAPRRPRVRLFLTSGSPKCQISHNPAIHSPSSATRLHPDVTNCRALFGISPYDARH